MISLEKCRGKEIYLNVREDIPLYYTIAVVPRDKKYKLNEEFANCSSVNRECFRNEKFFKGYEIFEIVEFKYLKLVDTLEEKMILVFYTHYDFKTRTAKLEDAIITLGIPYNY